jgi:hypothetical protein
LRAGSRALAKKITIANYTKIIPNGEVAVPDLGEPAAIAKQGSTLDDA